MKGPFLRDFLRELRRHLLVIVVNLVELGRKRGRGGDVDEDAHGARAIHADEVRLREELGPVRR